MGRAAEPGLHVDIAGWLAVAAEEQGQEYGLVTERVTAHPTLKHLDGRF